jgi:hypothetical protein
MENVTMKSRNKTENLLIESRFTLRIMKYVEVDSVIEEMETEITVNKYCETDELIKFAERRRILILGVNKIQKTL